MSHDVLACIVSTRLIRSPRRSAEQRPGAVPALAFLSACASGFYPFVTSEPFYLPSPCRRSSAHLEVSTMTVTVTLPDGGTDAYMRSGDAYVKHNDGTLDVLRVGAHQPHSSRARA